MPIRIPNDLPAAGILQQENIFVMTQNRAINQDIRPLEILVLNLMPTKIVTETQLSRLLGNTPLQVHLELMHTTSHKSKNVSQEHLLSFYKTFDELKAKYEEESRELKAKLEKQFKAEFDSLTAEITNINLQVSEYKQAVELNKHKTELAEVEARIKEGETSVNVILYSTYAMMALVLTALLVIILVMNGLTNPMSLVKLLVVVVVLVGLVVGAYTLAPGTMIQSETLTPDQISIADLKMTDTVLYLAYLFFGGAIVALITSWIVGAVRK